MALTRWVAWGNWKDASIAIAVRYFNIRVLGKHATAAVGGVSVFVGVV